LGTIQTRGKNYGELDHFSSKYSFGYINTIVDREFEVAAIWANEMKGTYEIK